MNLKIPATLEEQTNVAVTREDASGEPGALTVELDNPGTTSVTGSVSAAGW